MHFTAQCTLGNKEYNNFAADKFMVRTHMMIDLYSAISSLKDLSTKKSELASCVKYCTALFEKHSNTSFPSKP